MGSMPNPGRWADDAHLPAWLIADAVDDGDEVLSEDALEHLKSCDACATLFRQAAACADQAGFVPLLDEAPGSARLPDVMPISPALLSNLRARATSAFAAGQVWQLLGRSSAAMAVVTKVDTGGAFVAPLTDDPAPLTDPYAVQCSLMSTPVMLAAWFSLETFIHSEVFAGKLGDIDPALVAAGRAAWRAGSPLSGNSVVVGPSTVHREELVTYREQLQQQISELAFARIVPETDDDDDGPTAQEVLKSLGVKTAQLRGILHINATVAAQIRIGDRSLSPAEAQALSRALNADIPATSVGPNPDLLAAIASPRFRVLFGELARRRGTDEWAERRRAVDSQLNLAARATNDEGKWERLVDAYLQSEFRAAQTPSAPPK